MNIFRLLLICFFLFATSAFSEDKTKKKLIDKASDRLSRDYQDIKNDLKDFKHIFVKEKKVSKEVLKFGNETYSGDVKAGKAHGVGVYTFADGTKYQGKFSKNRFHGKGKYIDSKGNVLEGKWRYGKLYKKIDKSTRTVVELSVQTGNSNYIQIRGSGNASHLWFEAEPVKGDDTAKVARLETVNELDIFDMPTVFSPDYGDEKKLKEILDRKNAKIELQNELENEIVLTEQGEIDQQASMKSITAGDNTAGDNKETKGLVILTKRNLKTVYKLTAKGERDLQASSRSITAGDNKVIEKTHTTSGSGTTEMSGGGFC